MTIGPLVEQARRLDEAWMPDGCTVTRRVPGVWDPATNTTTGDTTTVVYEGRCRVGALDRSGVDVEAAGQAERLAVYAVRVPVAATRFLPGDVVVVTVCSDAGMVGRVLRVTDVRGGSTATNRTLVCIWEAR